MFSWIFVLFHHVETTHNEFISNLARTLFIIIIYYYHNKTPKFYSI